MITNADHARTMLLRALAANGNCSISRSAERVAVDMGSDPKRHEAVVALDAEAGGFVYGHVFASRRTGGWCALLLFSKADVIGREGSPTIARFRREVVEAFDFEPLLVVRRGEASASATSFGEAVSALCDMVGGYSKALVRMADPQAAGRSLDPAPLFEYRFADGLVRKPPE